jgi:hypothetical protein
MQLEKFPTVWHSINIWFLCWNGRSMVMSMRSRWLHNTS